MSTKEDETLAREKNTQVRRYKKCISNSPSDTANMMWEKRSNLAKKKLEQHWQQWL